MNVVSNTASVTMHSSETSFVTPVIIPWSGSSSARHVVSVMCSHLHGTNVARGICYKRQAFAAARGWHYHQQHYIQFKVFRPLPLGRRAQRSIASHCHTSSSMDSPFRTHCCSCTSWPPGRGSLPSRCPPPLDTWGHCGEGTEWHKHTLKYSHVHYKRDYIRTDVLTCTLQS